MKCNICSLYICVEDMNRAIKFYEDFFEQPVTERDKLYSIFDINGFRFGLFAYTIVNESHTFGSNCFPLTKIGRNWVAEFVDSEGNHIEITTPI